MLPYYPRPEQDGPKQAHERHLGKTLSRAMRLPARWTEYRYAGEDLELEELIYLLEPEPEWSATSRVVGAGRQLAVELPGERDFERPGSRRQSAGPDRPHVQLLGIPMSAARRNEYVFLYRSADAPDGRLPGGPPAAQLVEVRRADD